MILSYTFIFLTVLLWGTAPIFDKIALREGQPLIGLIIRSLTVIPFIIISGFFVKGVYSSAFKLPAKTILLFSLSGISAGVLGMLTYYSALKRLPSSVVVPLCSTYPLIAAFLGMVVLKEGFSFSKLAGVILIVIGIWLVK